MHDLMIIAFCVPVAATAHGFYLLTGGRWRRLSRQGRLATRKRGRSDGWIQFRITHFGQNLVPVLFD